MKGNPVLIAECDALPGLPSLCIAVDRIGVMQAVLETARWAGFDDIAYVAGKSVPVEPSAFGQSLQEVTYYSSAKDDWARQLFKQAQPDEDYDVRRILAGQKAPFHSGLNLVSLMGGVDAAARHQLQLKAKAGFGANFIVPILSSPAAPMASSVMMFLSNMSLDTYLDRLKTHGSILVGISHFLHYRLGLIAPDESGEDPSVSRTLSQAWPVPNTGNPGPLTDRQVLILQQIAAGIPYDRIARTLDISRVTVDRNLSLARKALKARTNAELLAKAMRAGLIAL